MISILGRLVVLAADDQSPLPEDCSDEVPPSTLQAALDYLQTHIDSKLTLDRVACAVGRSRSHLAKLFRQKTGGTFIDCLNQLRIQRAKELIGFYGRPRSFAEVARQCGFANHAHLTRTFVQYVGKNFPGLPAGALEPMLALVAISGARAGQAYSAIRCDLN